MLGLIRSCVFITLFILPSLLFSQTPRVLIVYFSQTGHTEAMAQAVARGARSVNGVETKIQTVAETSNADLLSADAIIVGSPVVNAAAAPEVVTFMSRWPFDGTPLMNKIGAAFVTGGGISAGEELAQLNILHSMLIFGMIVVGGPDWMSAFGASAVTVEAPFDSMSGKALLAKQFSAKGEGLGKRVAELCVKMRKGR